MLFGTFQEIPYDNLEELKKDHNAKPNLIAPWKAPRREIRGTGKYRMWAFPLDDISSAVAHALFTAPNIPDIFYVIETDDYVRINKVRHYQNIMNGDENVKGCIDANVDNTHSEFLLKPDELKNPKMVFSVTGLIPFLNGKSISNIIKNDLNMPKEAQDFIRSTMQKVPLMEAGKSDNYSEEYRYIFSHSSRALYLNFVICVLPTIVRLATNGGAEALWAASGVINWKKLLNLHNSFSHWSYEDCSIEKYNELFEEAKRYVIEEDWLIVDVLEHDLPGPNEKCPCGSGKKFKKCHGKYI